MEEEKYCMRKHIIQKIISIIVDLKILFHLKGGR